MSQEKLDPAVSIRTVERSRKLNAESRFISGLESEYNSTVSGEAVHVRSASLPPQPDAVSTRSRRGAIARAARPMPTIGDERNIEGDIRARNEGCLRTSRKPTTVSKLFGTVNPGKLVLS